MAYGQGPGLLRGWMVPSLFLKVGPNWVGRESWSQNMAEHKYDLNDRNVRTMHDDIYGLTVVYR